MPRFLNTWTGEFEWHDPKEVRYAILSHVWRTPEEGGEQTFDDVRRIQADVKAVREEPGGPYPAHWPQVSIFEFDTMNEPFPKAPNEIFSDPTLSDILYASLPDDARVIFRAESPLSDKIKGLCKVARDAGFELVWNDTCCIDKSSSAELSEAINSMYEWYRLSDICYVYLADVPDSDGIPQDWGSAFRRSRWHERGWTLQELIGPERIEFLTSSWRFLVTKLGLAGTLADITDIDINILLGRPPVESASVAQRMSWAVRRQTTRVEDRAYSVMGLFGVHMSPIYGEGTNAFLRLQEEIIRTIPDQSIFAWDNTCIGSDCLLASSPKSFAYADAKPITPSEFGSRLNLQGPEEVPPLYCTFTPQGVRIRLLCVDLTVARQRIPSLRQRHYSGCVVRRGFNREADRLALLQCEYSNGGAVGLTFHSSNVARDGRGSLVGDRCACSGNGWSRTIRLFREELAAILEMAKPEMTEVSLLRYSSDPPPSKILLPINSLLALDLLSGCDSPDSLATFDLSPDSIAALRMLGFTVSPLQTTQTTHKWITEITLKTTLAWRRAGLLHSLPLRISIEDDTPDGSNDARFCLSAAPLSLNGLASSPISTSCSATGSEAPGRDCKQIQKVDWNGVVRRYTLAQFDLLIRPYPQRPQQARVLRLSLKRTPQGCQPSAPHSSRTVCLVMEMSDEHKHFAEASTPNLNGHQARSPSPVHVRGVRSQRPDATKTPCTTLEKKVNALGRENSALRAQMSAATSQHAEMESKLAALARKNAALANQNAALANQNAALARQNFAITSQNTVLANRNAALEEQMAAVWRRLDALTAAVAPATSSPHTRRR